MSTAEIILPEQSTKKLLGQKATNFFAAISIVFQNHSNFLDDKKLLHFMFEIYE